MNISFDDLFRGGHINMQPLSTGCNTRGGEKIRVVSTLPPKYQDNAKWSFRS